MVALSQTWKFATQQPPSAQITRQTPLQRKTSLATPIRMVLRARYYDPASGEFTSIDPLEYVDGMSLFRGYLQLSNTDQTGMSISVNDIVKQVASQGNICGTYTIPIPAVPGLSLNLSFCVEVSFGECCDSTNLKNGFSSIKFSMEGYAQYGYSIKIKDALSNPKKPRGKERNEDIAHPCIPGKTVNRKDFERIKKRDCIDKGTGGGAGGSVSTGPCPEEGWDFNGNWFIRGSIGVGIGITAGVQGTLNPGSIFTDKITGSFTAGFTGEIGATLQIGISVEGTLTKLQPTSEICCKP